MAENKGVTFDTGGGGGAQKDGRKSIFGAISGFGNAIKDKVSGFFSSNVEDDDAPAIVDDQLEEETTEVNTIRGEGYQLSWTMHQDPNANSKSWFFTSPLGDPFPSYHTNPSPHFPARWTHVKGVKDPCESLTAPRIRLGPRELQYAADTIDKLAEAGYAEKSRTRAKVLNLAHQSLGDAYQFSSLVAFIDLNKTVEVLNLSDNQLEGITALNLRSVKKLYLSNNSFASFLAIPALPECEELHLSHNFITSTVGLTDGKFPKLRKISIYGNPIETQPNYRKQLARSLTSLVIIDKIDVSKMK